MFWWTYSFSIWTKWTTKKNLREYGCTFVVVLLNGIHQKQQNGGRAEPFLKVSNLRENWFWQEELSGHSDSTGVRLTSELAGHRLGAGRLVCVARHTTFSFKSTDIRAKETTNKGDDGGTQEGQVTPFLHIQKSFGEPFSANTNKLSAWKGRSEWGIQTLINWIIFWCSTGLETSFLIEFAHFWKMRFDFCLGKSIRKRINGPYAWRTVNRSFRCTASGRVFVEAN